MLKEKTYQKCRYLLSPVSLFTLCFTLVAIFLYSMECQAMFGFFKKTEVQLSPPVKGRITDKGQPLSGVEVVRELFYSGYDKKNPIIDYALTNTQGEFSFDEIVVKSRSPSDIFGQNIPVSQEIYIKKEANEDDMFLLWGASKHWRSSPPLNNLMLQLNADLQNKEVDQMVDTTGYNTRNEQLVTTICHWENDKVTTYYNNEVIRSYEEIN